MTDTYRSGGLRLRVTAMSSDRSYRIHGLQVRSEIELDGDLAAGRIDDVRVRIGPSRSVGPEPARGSVVAEFVTPEERWWTATEDETGYLIRFHTACDVGLNRELTTLTCWPDAGAGPDVVPLLASGTALSFVLGLQDKLVLHASAVQFNAGSVAFVGLPGMGKSTLAGLLCSGGGRLVTDDALRVDMDKGATCFRGTSKIRLRKAAESVLALYTEAEVGSSPDHRHTIRTVAADPVSRLSALVIPRPSRVAAEIIIEHVDSAEAVFRLSPFLRIARWVRPDLVIQHFRLIGQLVGLVPTYAMTVPWIAPFKAKLVSEIKESVEELINQSAPLTGEVG